MWTGQLAGTVSITLDPTRSTSRARTKAGRGQSTCPGSQGNREYTCGGTKSRNASKESTVEGQLQTRADVPATSTPPHTGLSLSWPRGTWVDLSPPDGRAAWLWGRGRGSAWPGQDRPPSWDPVPQGQ